MEKLWSACACVAVEVINFKCKNLEFFPLIVLLIVKQVVFRAAMFGISFFICNCNYFCYCIFFYSLIKFCYLLLRVLLNIFSGSLFAVVVVKEMFISTYGVTFDWW